jgi:hypothetical protein
MIKFTAFLLPFGLRNYWGTVTYYHNTCFYSYMWHLCEIYVYVCADALPVGVSADYTDYKENENQTGQEA